MYTISYKLVDFGISILKYYLNMDILSILFANLDNILSANTQNDKFQ